TSMPSRLNISRENPSTGNSWRPALPVSAVSPPYIVTASSLPSSWRWSCFSRKPSSVRVTTQVRDRSSPTWKGMRISASLHSRTCITSGLPSNASGVVLGGSLAAMVPAKAWPHRAPSRSKKASWAVAAGASGEASALAVLPAGSGAAGFGEQAERATASVAASRARGAFRVLSMPGRYPQSRGTASRHQFRAGPVHRRHPRPAGEAGIGERGLHRRRAGIRGGDVDKPAEHARARPGDARTQRAVGQRRLLDGGEAGDQVRAARLDQHVAQPRRDQRVIAAVQAGEEQRQAFTLPDELAD